MPSADPSAPPGHVRLSIVDCDALGALLEDMVRAATLIRHAAIAETGTRALKILDRAEPIPVGWIERV